MSADEGRRYDALDEKDWQDILKELEKAVLRAVPSWLRVQSDDLVQKSAAKILSQHAGLAPHREGEHQHLLNRSYLWKVATTTVIDETRRVCYQREQAIGDRDEETARVHSPNPERQARMRELADEIRDCLKRLGTDRSLAVRLYLLGESVAEIGERMNWALKRSKNLVYRGLADMRACLSAKGYEGEHG